MSIMMSEVFEVVSSLSKNYKNVIHETIDDLKNTLLQANVLLTSHGNVFKRHIAKKFT